MELPRDYPLAVAVAVGMNIQCLLSGFGVGAARKTLFNKIFMEK